jgi:hypothetical protein
MKMILMISILMLSSCAGFKKWTKDVMEPKSDMDEVHQYHRPLEKQRLIPRPKHEGFLTNRVCTDFYGPDCEKESIKEYDLSNKKIRENFIELGFACVVSGKRYRFCPDKPGFCRKEFYKECSSWGKRFFSRARYCKQYKEFTVEKYLDGITDYKFLLDGTMECKKGL